MGITTYLGSFGSSSGASSTCLRIGTNGFVFDTTANVTDSGANTKLAVVGRTYLGSNTNATSTVHIGGSLATVVTTTTANLTLDITHYTVIFDGTSLTATLPTASTCNGRIYVLVNRNATALTTSIAYQTLTTGVTSTTVTAASSVWLQSNGTSWYQIK
jgi:hypothetical protein